MRQYALITANYWAFTLTDGALRMLVVLYFHGLGYSPLEIAFLFVFYELFGVVTNLTGGWLGAALGLNRTMQAGLALQLLALSMLLVPTCALSIAWVMAAQALSGVAKDLNKMSAKSAIKLLVPANAQGRLYKLVALLTGSKNALKGLGFFLGGALLSGFGFRGALLCMLSLLAVVWLLSLFLLAGDLGKTTRKPKFSRMLSKSPAINTLSAARFFLFGARDVWFVIALPLYLSSVFLWSHIQVSGFLALWIIGYGAIQAAAPGITGTKDGRTPDGRSAQIWVLLLALVTLGLAFLPHADLSALQSTQSTQFLSPATLPVLLGLILFAAVFAINSSLHSYLIVSYADADGVSMDVGFYYMANAAGRLVGTLLSGWLSLHIGSQYGLQYGLSACLLVAALFLFSATMISSRLPRNSV